MKKIIIAIDGYSACGKSTLAKDIAQALQYTYIDSGAMYRAVTLYFLRHQVDIKNQDEVNQALEHIQISFQQTESGNRTILNGEDVERNIRTMEVAQFVSPVAALSPVRTALVAQQQLLGKAKGIVMDGRDIGTVVFPDADLKLFISASVEARTERRFLELQEKGQNVDRAAIQANLEERDHIDSTRSDSPLRQAEDAIVLDNTNLNRKEQLDHVLGLLQNMGISVPSKN